MNTLIKPDLAAIKIRNKLLPGDLGYIAHVHGDLYAKECGYGLNFEAYVLQGLKDFALEYDEAKDKVWICEHGKRIIGCLVAQHRSDALQLRYFIFLPEYRGIGLGKKLMEEFLDFMKYGSYSNAYLWTTEEQRSAIALYIRYGFKLSDEKPSNTFGKELLERRYDLVLNQ